MTLKVRTVLGDISPEELGFTLPHEHLINSPPVSARPDPDYRIDDVDKAIEEVRIYQRAGGSALAEMTGIGYGRDVEAIKYISEQTGLHIVSGSGFIMESLFPLEAFEYTEGQLADLLVKEVTEGVGDTGIRTGMLKCGTSPGRMTPTEEKVMRAVAKAHLVTGATINTHTMGGTMALSQIEVLTSEGVDPSRIIIGHVDRQSLAFGYFKLLLGKGVYLGIDNIGKTKYYPDNLRIEILKELFALGYVKQILLSDDNGRQSYFASYGGGPGLDYIPRVFVPMLREAGVSDEDIYQMTVLNPRTTLSFDVP